MQSPLRSWPTCEPKLPLLSEKTRWDSQRRSRKNPNHLLDLLGSPITSKTRLKLLTRFFLNQSVDGYLQGLSKELDENTNSIRVELNRLEKAGLLASKTEGRRKHYSPTEMKHSPITLIDENMPVVVVAPNARHYEKLVSNFKRGMHVAEK